MSSSKDRKTITLGDVLISTDKDGSFEQDANGTPKRYHLKVFLPEDVDGVTLKSGDYINFRILEEQDFEKMPDNVKKWKEPLAQLRAWTKNPDYKG